MKIIEGTEFSTGQNIAASIGFFDGVHMGHQHLIRQIINVAQQRHLHSAVITFRQHPRKVVQPGFLPQLLTSFEERMEHLAATGIDYCFLLDFTPEMAQLTAREFIGNIMYEQLSVTSLIVGYDHRFGKNRSEDFDDYVRYGNEVGMNASKADVYQMKGINISSSYIREKVLSGEVEEASLMLNRPYTLTGTVVKGKQLGRTIGFPTANVQSVDNEKIIPAKGVYAARVRVGEQMYDAILNIGVRPTIGDKNSLTIEVHLLNFTQDIYGEEVSVLFVRKLRDERKMSGLDELKRQIEQDKQAAIALFAEQ